MARPPEYEGRRITVRCVELPGGKCPAGDFLDTLDDRERRKLDVIFQRLGDEGRVTNKEKFRKLEGSDKIFEVKSFQIRLLCFFTPYQRLMLAFGLIKKSDRHKPQDIERAERIKAWYFSQLEESG